jgi:hypothetical protein
MPCPKYVVHSNTSQGEFDTTNEGFLCAFCHVLPDDHRQSAFPLSSALRVELQVIMAASHVSITASMAGEVTINFSSVRLVTIHFRCITCVT